MYKEKKNKKIPLIICDKCRLMKKYQYIIKIKNNTKIFQL